ncbi:TPR Domain containing protein [Histomonas meleagridis]|uniref:TPR Domain containing protein n=1 Tax=Histomonas meleagridis TaxID=135588 RepID=UPI00355940B9|nr:TPR Domain containing protein [Histomonas meleagridis]KAH0806684.1 TPR Domain containing protein [Histomonas meleagridis]
MAENGSISVQINNSIEAACKEVEKTWEGILTLSNILSDNYSDTAIRRLLSYNPSNHSIASNPKLWKSVEKLLNIISLTSKKIQADPNNFSLWATLGHCYLLLNDFPNSYSAYTRALNINGESNDPYFWLGIASTYQHFGYSVAIDFMNHVISLLSEIKELKSDVKFRLSMLYRERNNYAKSTKILQDLRPCPPLNLREDDLVFQIAFNYQLDQQYIKANDKYHRLYKSHPNCIKVIQQYAWFLSLQNDISSHDKANKLISSVPGDPLLKFAAARIAMKHQDMNTAYQRFSECNSYFSETPLFWCNLGVLYFKNGQMKDAIIAFQRALYLRGDIVEAWANLGLIFELKDMAKNALDIYQASFAQCPKSPMLRERYANLNSGRAKMPTPSMILDIGDSSYFQQVPEKIVAEYNSLPPAIPVNGLEESELAVIREFSSIHKSIF